MTLLLLTAWVHTVFGTVRRPSEQDIPPPEMDMPLADPFGSDPAPISLSPLPAEGYTADTPNEGPRRLTRTEPVIPDRIPTVPQSPEAPDTAPTALPDTASTPADTTRKKAKPFLEDMVTGKNRDSLIYDVKKKFVYIYTEGDISYQDLNLKGDYMEIDMTQKQVFAHGYTDSLGSKTRPEFTQGAAQPYTMDTLLYNFETGRAKIKGAATREGDGFLMGEAIKKMEDNTINILKGRYTTCDHIENPHFYLAMTKAKLIPNKKVVTGPAFLVIEEVPIYFPFLPFGFFPITKGRSSGVIMPSFGEENRKGFFLREGGYYWAVNDYMDVALTGGYYTLGSWEGQLYSRYAKRYRYSGDLKINYVNTIIGEKGDDDYVNGNSLSVRWSHRQDPKFRPNSQFSASVEFSTGGYSEYGTNNLNDYLQTQTSSSITYTKSWPGKPFNFSTNASHSQNSRDSTYTFNLPNFNFNVSRLFPFKGKNYVGKERWYHKISTSYNGSFTNTVTVKERDLFTEDMFKQMNNSMTHSIPVTASFTAFNYLNLSPSVRYNEKWHFKKITKEWDPVQKAQIVSDTTYGFYRTYDYNFSISADTRIYGQFDFLGKDPVIKAIRHVMSPNVSFSYKPDFTKSRYGFQKPIQIDSMGTIGVYSPYEGASVSGESMSLSFRLGNTIEAKVRSDSDTSGVKKIKILDELSISSSYNFLAKEFKLSPFSVSVRSTLIPQFGINFNMTFDPYQLDEKGQKVDKFMFGKGSLARLTNLSTSFGYTFGPGSGGAGGGDPAMNNFNNMPTPDAQQQDFFNRNNIDPAMQRAMMTGMYYDFNIPWSLNVNYSLQYSKPGLTKNITQTLGFNASVNLTEKWALTWNGNFDIKKGEFAPGQIYITRDLHCWQMNLSWIPTGQMQQWSFNISVKSSVLRDLKYDRRSSRFDRLYDQ